MPPTVCTRCGQTYHEAPPRWDCACGPARTGAFSAAVTVAASDDPATWYDHFSCYPADPAPGPAAWLQQPLPARVQGQGT